MRAKGFLDFSMDRLTERNKENSFLDVDWIIEELLSLGQHRISNESPSTNTTPEMTSPLQLYTGNDVTFSSSCLTNSGSMISSSSTR